MIKTITSSLTARKILNKGLFLLTLAAGVYIDLRFGSSASNSIVLIATALVFLGIHGVCLLAQETPTIKASEELLHNSHYLNQKMDGILMHLDPIAKGMGAVLERLSKRPA